MLENYLSTKIKYKPHTKMYSKETVLVSSVNPISLRIWFPRIVDDMSFSHLLMDLKSIRADRVYLFDNSYMDNFQLSSDTLSERLPILRKRILQLKEEGIIAGINSGATIGHVGNMAGAEKLLDLDWWIGADGKNHIGIACPLGERFLSWLDLYFHGLAETGATEIFIDDDLRPFNHGACAPSEWGCFCDIHIEALNAKYCHSVTRDELINELTHRPSDQIGKDWFELWQKNILDILGRIECIVHAANPNIRLGLMPVQNFIRAFGEEFMNKAIRLISGSNRPLLRTHDYHGLPHEIIIGSGIAAKLTVHSESEHLVEIENTQHNCHEYIRSPKTSRFAILSALAVGMGGASFTFGDDQRDMSWEQKYLNMFKDNDSYFRTVAKLTANDTIMRGISIRNRAYQRQNTYFDTYNNIIQEAKDEQTDVLAGIFGFAYQFDTLPIILQGELPQAMSREEVESVIERGAIIDVSALECLNRLGYGDKIGVSVGKTIEYRRGHRFLNHQLNGEYCGNINALRTAFPVYDLNIKSNYYEEVTEFVSWNGQRVAGGVLVSRCEKNRNVILPHVLSANPPYISGIVNTQYRSLIKLALEYITKAPLHLYVDGPPNIAPFYFERTTDDAVIITLTNRYYDDLYDFDLILGEGERLQSKEVYRVMPNGSIENRKSLKIVYDGNHYRLTIDRDNILENCDVMTLLIK